MEEKNNKPWLKWPHRVLAPGSLKDRFPEYKYLDDPEVHVKMLNEVRAQFLKLARKQLGSCKGLVCFFKGGTSAQVRYYDNDTSIDRFRQEPFFRYLFGVNVPNAKGFVDLDSGRFVLGIQKQHEDSVRWNGELRSNKEFGKRYGLDVVHNDALFTELKESKPSIIFVLNGVNSDSGVKFTNVPDLDKLKESFKEAKINQEFLYPFLGNCRSLKTKLEIDLMRVACKVTSMGHIYVQRNIRPDLTEFQCEALFKGFCGMFGGSRHCAYVCICASGMNGSILHYGHAEKPNLRNMIHGDMVLFDMGGEYNGYATDITNSYPISGKFTQKQRLVYQTVLNAAQAVIKELKEGTQWTKMHRLAEREILTGLQKMKVLDPTVGVDELMKAELGAVFMPHGLGHFIGLSVHDTAGFTEEEKRSEEHGLKYLRTTRVLKAGNVITVEPGLYFIKSIIEKALKAKHQGKYINEEELKKYLDFGGVRIEDDVVITKDGCENLTILPREIEDIEELMALKLD